MLSAPSAPDFQLSIEAMRRQALPDAADQIKFTLKGIKLTGVTAFPAEHFAPLYSASIGQQVKLSDLVTIADAIEGEYRKAGFVLSRAYIPPQRVRDGILEIAVVEGYVANVAVTVNDPHPLIGRDLDSLLSSYFDRVTAERPLSDPTIDQAMLLANDLPGRSAAGVLHPSQDHPGASDLVVTENSDGWTGGASVDNRGSSFAGPVLLHFDAATSPGILAGDWLSGVFATTPDSAQRMEAALVYSVPVGTEGAILSFDASGSYGKPEGALSPISLVTSSYAFGPHLHYPLLRSRSQSLSIDAGFDWHAADVVALAKPFSHDEWRTASVSLTYSQNGWLNGVSVVALSLTQGLPIFGATSNGSFELSRPGAATDFTKIGLTAQRAQRLFGPVSLAINVQAQYAFAPLIAGEQLGFGGDSIGRGYDPAAVLGDHGVGGSFELRYDHRFEDSWLTTVEPYIFTDTGAVWDRRPTAPGNSRLSSVGAGVRFGLIHEISGGIEVAKELLGVSDNDNGRHSARLLLTLGVRL